MPILVKTFLSSQEIGFTTVDPAFATVESSVVSYSTTFDSSSEHWILKYSHRFHNGQTLESLKPGESVAIAVDSKRDLHFFYKGEHESVIWEGLPMKPLWGLVDVHGKVASVKVELLQSE